MLFAVIFLVAFAALGAFAFYLSRHIEHGEARFDTTGSLVDKDKDAPRPAMRRDGDKNG